MSNAMALEPLLPPEDAAKILNLSTSWLAKSRMRGQAPEFVKIGRAVRYSMSGLQKFIQAQTRKSTDGVPDETNDSNRPPNENEG
jgi:predicted DNA-binding transcriptional regulator AlpA